MCCCVTLSARLQIVSDARACIALTFDTEAKKLSEGEVCAIVRRVCNRQKSVQYLQYLEECAILAIVRRVRNR